MYSYGFYWQYGIGTVSANDYQPVGDVMVFDSKRERDEWIAGDKFDGNWHRSAMSAREARRLMVNAIFEDSKDYGSPGQVVYELAQTYGTPSSMYQLVPTSKLVKTWKLTQA